MRFLNYKDIAHRACNDANKGGPLRTVFRNTEKPGCDGCLMSKCKYWSPSLLRTLFLSPRLRTSHFICLMCWRETRAYALWSFVSDSWCKAPKPMLGTNEPFQTQVCLTKEAKEHLVVLEAGAIRQVYFLLNGRGVEAGRLNVVPPASCSGIHWEGRSLTWGPEWPQHYIHIAWGLYAFPLVSLNWGWWGWRQTHFP